MNSAATESDAGGDAGAAAAAAPAAASAIRDGGDEAKKKQEEELREELAKTEEEVATLRQVLTSKQKRAAELRKKLGINVVTNLKSDVQDGLRSLSESDVVQKTNTAFKSVGESFSTVGRKIGSVKESAALKLIQQKVGGAYNSLKVKVTGKESEQPGGSKAD